MTKLSLNIQMPKSHKSLKLSVKCGTMPIKEPKIDFKSNIRRTSKQLLKKRLTMSQSTEKLKRKRKRNKKKNDLWRYILSYTLLLNLLNIFFILYIKRNDIKQDKLSLSYIGARNVLKRDFFTKGKIKIQREFKYKGKIKYKGIFFI